jgi:hypothetical protein
MFLKGRPIRRRERAEAQKRRGRRASSAFLGLCENSLRATNGGGSQDEKPRDFKTRGYQGTGKLVQFCASRKKIFEKVDFYFLPTLHPARQGRLSQLESSSDPPRVPGDAKPPPGDPGGGLQKLRT